MYYSIYYLGFLDTIGNWLKEFCTIYTTMWNGLIDLLNFFLGIALNPIGFLWWLVSQGLNGVAEILPEIPSEMTLQYVIDNLGQITGIGTDLIAELIGIASQFLVVVGIIKLYKLIPFKMS